MKKISTKQAKRNRIISEYKKLHVMQCVICGRSASEMAHLLPKSIFPEYYTEPDNLVILCRECHQMHDDNCDFRTRQDKLFKQACKVNEAGAKRYYRR